jgi:hypothetical protein
MERSLTEIADWDWYGTQILVEHCDARSGIHQPVKGFLALEDELAVVDAVRARARTDVGIVINWGRSTIEGRDVSTPVRHVAAVKEAGLLRGVVFSGCSAEVNGRGGAWADVHLPPQLPGAKSEPSLLGRVEIAETIRAAGRLSDLTILGMKITCPPEASVDERCRILADSAALITDEARLTSVGISPS